MSDKELDRLMVLKNVQQGLLSQVQAARALRVSDRQIRRLLAKLDADGPAALISKKRGVASNRAIPAYIKQQALSIVKRDYYDYGPTLAAEKLAERNNIYLGKETMRRWMLEAGIRKLKQQKQKKIHYSRARRDCFGELVQIDGSIHDWFEGRGEKCTLLVFIDDATSKLTICS